MAKNGNNAVHSLKWLKVERTVHARKKMAYNGVDDVHSYKWLKIVKTLRARTNDSK